VVLGSGDKPYEEMFRRLNRQFPKKFLVKIAYDDVLAHKIEAGADMFLMPSRYEPCGLNQIYSLRYGTIPVVRATGGLDDTIDDAASPGGTGFKFKNYSATEMVKAIQRAVAAYADQPSWRKLVKNGMAKDFSWEASAKKYIQLYRTLTRK
jgi:starch synthase